MIPKVAICVPTFRLVEPEVLFRVMNVVLHSQSIIGAVWHVKGMYIDAARNHFCQQAIEQKATHMFFVDDDMMLPADVITKLLMHNVGIVGAQYFRKFPPHDTVAGDWIESDNTGKIYPPQTLPKGLLKIHVLGMGATLIETRLLVAMKEQFGDEHWFRSDVMGEDLHFCERLLKMGEDVWLDCDTVCEHKVSQEIGLEHWKAYHTPQTEPRIEVPLNGDLRPKAKAAVVYGG